ncbi:hypothetical protein KC19_6G197900 [Ceratodon purpureus]|uniref:Uncharacterized protein n=1 Tax=Ceratodon purpureus TaxID=3225 RepID=A0A8T0HJF5_CERPU|nr:hypothetical protein KC19_6G197900 [Ceratodon purpureus]
MRATRISMKCHWYSLESLTALLVSDTNMLRTASRGLNCHVLHNLCTMKCCLCERVCRTYIAMHTIYWVYAFCAIGVLRIAILGIYKADLIFSVESPSCE